jgi:hypothetical protein
MEDKLNIAIGIFEAKINKLESIYKDNHKNNFDSNKMKQFVNRNLKKEIALLTTFNIKPSVEILSLSHYWI